MHDAAAAVQERDLYLAEIVLTELAGQPLEAHHQFHVTRTQARRQGVQRALAPFVPIQPSTPQDFHRQYLRVLLQELLHQNPERLGSAGAPDLAPSSLLLVIDAFDAGLLSDSSNRPPRDLG